MRPTNPEQPNPHPKKPEKKTEEHFDLEKLKKLFDANDNFIQFEGQIISFIKESSIEDYYELICSLEEHPNKKYLTEKIIESIIDKYCLYVEKETNLSSDGSVDSSQKKHIPTNFLAFHVSQALSDTSAFTRDKKHPLSVSDRTMRALVKVLPNHPSGSAYYLIDQFGQNGQIVNPHIFIKSVMEILNDPKSAIYQDDLLSVVNYLFSFFDIYKKEILDNLDFSQPDNFSKTGRFLEFLQKLADYGENWVFSEENGQEIKAILQEALEKKQGSFLLNIRIKQILNGASEKNQINHFDQEVAPGVSGHYERNFLFIKKPHSAESLPLEASDLSLPSHWSEEEKKQTILDFSYLASPIVKNIVNESLNIDLSKLSLREQCYFLQFLKDKPENTLESIKSFFKQYGNDGLRTFLSIEQEGLSMGDKILFIGEKMPPESAEQIFKKYGELVEVNENLQEKLSGYLNSKEITNEERENISKNLTHRANQLLLNMAEKLNQNEKVSEDELFAELNKCQEETVLFTSLFRSLSQEKDFSWEAFRHLDLKIENGQSLNTFDQEKMFAMAEENYHSQPALKEVVFQGIENGFNTPNTRFYILKKSGKIIAFCRFEESEKEIYFGSFNVAPELQGSTIGETLLKEALAKEAQSSKTIVAYSVPESPISQKYINDFGFTIADIDFKHDGQPIILLKIERDDNANKNYLYPKESPERILQRQKFDQHILRFSKDAFRKKLSEIKNFLAEHPEARGTRFFTQEEAGKKVYYLVLERKINA